MKKLVEKSDWEKLDISLEFGDEQFQDLAYIEELNDYEILDSTGSSKKRKFADEDKPISKPKKKPKILKNIPVIVEDLDTTNVSADSYAAWKAKKLSCIPDEICKGLYSLGFVEPTPIQRSIIPCALIDKKNIIASAQTGSGKTLAFIIPIFAQLMRETDATPNVRDKKSIKSLIVTPTRELAFQIRNHALALAKYMKTKIKIVTLVGGMSIHKQERLLKGEPALVIATPGRLSELLSLYASTRSASAFALNLKGLRFLVMDEADKMVNAGHWQDMKSILWYLKDLWKTERLAPVVQVYIISATLSISTDFKNSLRLMDEETKVGRKKSKKSFTDASAIPLVNKFKRLFQSLPFTKTQNISAITSVPMSASPDSPPRSADLAEKKKKADKKGAKRNKRRMEEEKKISRKLDFHVVDLSSQQMTVPTLKEIRANCQNFDEKDLYLYYFLTIYLHNYLKNLENEETPGEVESSDKHYKILVFCNSIDCVRRLHSLFSLLLMPGQWDTIVPNTRFLVSRLHASMSQRDRLKCMDKFLRTEKSDINPTSATKSVKAPILTNRVTISTLFATDLAARGLDLPLLDCVTHYELPRSLSAFVHRCGRTARAGKNGVSLSLIAEGEVKNYVGFCNDRSIKTNDVPLMDPPDIKMTQILKDRIKMATDLENTIHRYEKGIRHQKWEDKIIRAFDLEENQSPRNWMDDNSENDAGHDTAAKRQIEKMKKRLKESFLIPLSPQYLLSSSIHNRKQTSLRYPH